MSTPIAISFDVDGTLGKQSSQINEKNLAANAMA